MSLWNIQNETITQTCRDWCLEQHYQFWNNEIVWIMMIPVIVFVVMMLTGLVDHFWNPEHNNLKEKAISIVYSGLGFLLLGYCALVFWAIKQNWIGL